MTNLSFIEAFSAANRRMASSLAASTPPMAKATPPLFTAMRLAARQVGVTLSPQMAAGLTETTAEAIERIAGRSDLIVRRITIGDQNTGDLPAPVLAFRLMADSDPEPVLLLRVGTRWRISAESSGWQPKRLDRFTADAFLTEGYMLIPALSHGRLNATQLLRYGLHCARPDLIAFFAMTLLAAGIVALIPLASDQLFEIVVPEREGGLLLDAAILLVMLVLTNLLVRFASALAKLRIEGKVGFFLRAAAVQRAIRIADWQAQNGQQLPSAPLAALAARSLERWQRGVWSMVLTIAAGLLTTLPSLVVVATTSVNGALIIGGIVLALTAMGYVIARLRAKALLDGISAQQSWMTTAYESLTMLDTVRATASEGRVFSRWTDGFVSLRHRFFRSDRVGVGAQVLEDATEGLLVLGAIVALTIAMQQSQANWPISLIVAAGSIAGAVTALLGSFGQATMLAMQFRMIEPLLHADTSAMRPQPQLKLKGRIDIDNLFVQHRSGGPASLQDITLHIAPGEHIGIAGPSGAGKSTLIRAILGMLPASGGRIAFDGIDIERVDTHALRRQIGVVGQNDGLFPGTVFENISAGLPLTLADVKEAACLAGLEQDIESWPLGLGTPVAQTEAGFSGGEIQRILLARAFAARPKILIFDEATSALDPARQDHVARAIDKLDATVISIAHRLETLKACNRIVVIRDGMIAEVGRYDELASKGGLFSQMLKAEV